jgi:hypothetical protein
VVVVGWLGYFFLFSFAVFEFFSNFFVFGNSFVGVGHGLTHAYKSISRDRHVTRPANSISNCDRFLPVPKKYFAVALACSAYSYLSSRTGPSSPNPAGS